LHRRLRALEETAAGAEAEKLFANATAAADGARLISQKFEGRDAESLKQLAHALIANAKTIVLLGSHDGEAARLLFARSEDASGDMNALMREACALMDGRGGGRPDMAQGGGKNVAKLDDALNLATAKLQEQL
jgi:alanyl-tRNA synthetase